MAFNMDIGFYSWYIIKKITNSSRDKRVKREVGMMTINTEEGILILDPNEPAGIFIPYYSSPGSVRVEFRFKSGEVKSYLMTDEQIRHLFKFSLDK